jgi:hypothetical protein
MTLTYTPPQIREAQTLTFTAPCPHGAVAEWHAIQHPGQPTLTFVECSCAPPPDVTPMTEENR